ncbi:hypothetical protein [Micromonospora sp. NBC_01412]|uniref:hypothetical protein n=1 Tax=Micromonospora sp. NBC_01412 TaxID=2903590 RepID=UPI0032459685
MSAFTPFDYSFSYFYAPDTDTEKKDAASYLRDHVNTHDTTEFLPRTNEIDSVPKAYGSCDFRLTGVPPARCCQTEG